VNFWDTSAFIAAHDALSPVFDRARGLLKQKTLHTASALIQPEAISAMTRRLKPDETAIDAACSRVRHSLSFLDLFDVDSEVLQFSTEIARKHHLRGADAVHLATALTIARGFGRRGFYFLTLDREQAAAARARKLKVVLDL
jgi:predicted nucleic acid-binding protein